MRLHYLCTWRGYLSRLASTICVTFGLMTAWPDTMHAAQNPATSSLTVTVVDPSGAVIPHASLSVARQEETSEAPWTVSAASPGVLVALHLPAGRYTIRVDADGFETTTANIRVADGDKIRRTVRLTLARVAETVVVDRDRQRDAVDPHGFSTFLSREQIEALPDDPESFARALQALAPPGAVIRVDGFTGGSLPPKSQILSIRIPRLDTFAAEDHGGLNGLSFIDLVTRPGGNRLAGGADFSFRNDALTARNPLSAEEGRDLLRAGTFTLDGPIVRGLMSFSLSGRAADQQDDATIHAALPDGVVMAQPFLQPLDALTLSGRVATTLGDGRTLRVSFANERRIARNLGVGETSLPERGYTTESSDLWLRAAGGGTLGRRLFLDVRTQLRRSGSRTRSYVEAPAIHVIDAFSAGGAQRAGGALATELEMAADVDYTWRAHAFRFGGLVEHGRYHSKRGVNYLGTYTFATLADYTAGQPASYTRRLGDPEVWYENTQVGLYAQDDVRIARSLLVSVGLRVEEQSIVGEAPDVLPRAALAWSPFRTGTTTVRTGFGAFADWLPVPVYEQSLLVDGVRQHDVLLLGPSYPAPTGQGVFGPSERYTIAAAARLPRSAGMTVGVEHQAAPGVRLYASYSHRRAYGLLRGRNLNAPVDGLRPDPAFGNVVETRGDAGSRVHTLTMQAVMTDSRHRAELIGLYVLTDSRTNTTGPFGVPTSGDRIDSEWGAVSPAHIAAATLTARLPGNLSITVMPRWRSGTPYSVTTGRDDNRDGLFTDRPAGVARNSERTPPQWEIGARVAFVARFGTGGAGALPSEGNDSESSRAGAVAHGTDEASHHASRRLELFASAQNVTNHANYAVVSGVLASPFYGQPTVAARPRTIEIGARVGF